MALPLPPQALRRVLLAPAVVLGAAFALATLPFWLLGASFAVRWLPGRWRGLRLLWFLLNYLVREAVGIVALAALWVASGFGRHVRSERFQRAHVVLAGWFLGGLVTTARRVLGLVVEVDDATAEPVLAEPFRGDPPDGTRPVLVFSRHAGAGDSFVLVEMVVNAWGRRPRIVLKEMLQLDPCIDVVLHRLPSSFIGGHRQSRHVVVESIAELAAGLEPDGALVLFPEGGNFTPARRARAIQQLRDAGLDHLVPLAEELTNVMPPRPGGAFAALDAAPGADVLFVAHTGLEQLSSPRDLWRGLPMRRGVRVGIWAVPAQEVPTGSEERLLWLYGWWEHIDSWIDGHRLPGSPTAPL